MCTSDPVLFIHLAMGCSWSPLAGALGPGVVRLGTPATSSAASAEAGTACMLPLSLTSHAAISSGMNHEQKTKQELFKKFSSPSLQLSCPVSYSWQFILQEFSHLRFQWLMWWTFYPFPGKSPARFSTPPCHFPRGSHSCYIFISFSFPPFLVWRQEAQISWVHSHFQCNWKAAWQKKHLENKDGHWTKESFLEVAASRAERWLEEKPLL